MALTMDKIRRLKQAYEEDWMAIDGVVAVGVGLTSQGSPGIIVSISRNLEEIRDKIPSSVEDVPVEIIQSGEIFAQ